MNRLQEKLYMEIFLDCETQGCLAVYEADVEANDPMDIWATRNGDAAAKLGWRLSPEGKVLCPKCVEVFK